MSQSRVYFPNLNGARFIAALLVIVCHVEMTKSWLGLPNIYKTSFVGGVFGQLGIILFFVLSGFLITYLLLEEHRVTKTISIKQFYIRRVLRIWPLYYLLSIAGLFILPHFAFFDIPNFSEYVNDNLFMKSLMYLTFFSDVAYTIYPHVPYSSQTWSVGVEEQFYLLWPVLMLFAIRKNKVLPALLGTIAVYLVIKTISILIYAPDMGNIAKEHNWLFWDHFSIDCMAIGGIGAYLLYYKKERILNILFNRYTQFAVYTILAIVTVKGWVVPWYNKEWYGVLFMIVILNLAANRRSLFNLEYRPVNYLGKISYGLYMYHNLVLTVVIKLFAMYGIINFGSLWAYLVIHIVSLGASVAVSALSYEYFEKRFIHAKVKYSKVVSGENATEDEEAAKPSAAAQAPAIPVPMRAQTA